MKKILFSFGLCFLITNLNAADNFTDVYELLTSKCASCHGGDTPAASLDFSGSESEVYAALMNAEVQNQAAINNGYALVKPGTVRESFLFRKINNALDEGAMLHADEGTLMPTYSPPLEDFEIELVRQWIAAGAKETGESFKYDIIKEYYQEGGIANIEPLAPPAEGEGFQIYLEPIFLEPGGETEYFNKLNIEIPDGLEVVGLEANIDDFSHHFILYKYDDNANVEIPDGRRYLSSSLFDNLNTIIDIFTQSVPVGVWQYNLKHDLPEGTAYFWNNDSSLDLNYHVKNYSQNQIMAGQVYLNVYTQPTGNAEVEMQAGLISYGNNNPFSLSIPNNAEDTTFVMEQYYNSSDTMHVWLLQSHTHQYGVDFDMYLRNEDGSLGEQIYEGKKDVEHQEDIGFYDYSHPPVLIYDDELLAVPLNQGITHVATYNNYGDNSVNFGLTTNDEMFITYFHYTMEALPPKEVPTNNSQLTQRNFNVEVAPNPYNEKTTLTYELEKSAEVEIKIFNVLGELMQTISTNQQNAGQHQLLLQNDWQAGMYLVQLIVDGEQFSKEIIKTE